MLFVSLLANLGKVPWEENLFWARMDPSTMVPRP